MTPLILIGGGGHCRSCIDVIESTEQYEIVGIVDPAASGNQSVLGYPVIGRDSDLPELLNGGDSVLITVGQIKDVSKREQLFETVKNFDGSFPIVMSPVAYVSKHAELNAGTIVMHGATVNVDARIGFNCIINSHALIEHDVVIGSHTHISTGARINGGAHIGARSFVGSGAVVNNGIEVGENCLIASGSIIRSNVPPGTRVRGEW